MDFSMCYQDRDMPGNAKILASRADVARFGGPRGLLACVLLEDVELVPELLVGENKCILDDGVGPISIFQSQVEGQT